MKSQVSSALVLQYAEFWERLVALAIDVAIMSAINFLIIIAFFGGIFGQMISLITAMSSDSTNGAFSFGSETMFSFDENFSSVFGLVFTFAGSFFLVGIVIVLVNYLYYTLMESSRFQGTLGKIAMRIKVTDDHGNRIGFGRATGRYFARIFLSGILFIGYIIAAFSEKRQTLHDLLVNTLVLKR